MCKHRRERAFSGSAAGRLPADSAGAAAEEEEEDAALQQEEGYYTVGISAAPSFAVGCRACKLGLLCGKRHLQAE